MGDIQLCDSRNNVIEQAFGNHYELIAIGTTSKRYYRYYQTDVSFEKLEYIKKILETIFNTISACFGNSQNHAHIYSQWRELYYIKKEIILDIDKSWDVFSYEDTKISQSGKINSSEALTKFIETRIELIKDFKETLEEGSWLDYSNEENQICVRDKSVFKFQLKELTKVPDELIKYDKFRTISLSNNEIEYLPDISNLSKLEVLGLRNNKLKKLPDLSSLHNLYYLSLNNNQFTTVPSCLYRMSPTCNVILCGNPLTEEARENLIDRISDPEYIGPIFYFDSQSVPMQPRVDITKNLSFWCDEECANKILKLDITYINNLKEWLPRIKGIQYYRENQEKVKTALKEILTWLSDGSLNNFQKQAWGTIGQASGGCDDRIALILNALLTFKAASKSSNIDNLEDLNEFILSMHRYDLLKKIVEEKCTELTNRGVNVDWTEQLLFFEINLKETLKLPLQIGSMIFRNQVRFTEDDVKKIADRILEETKDAKKTLLSSELTLTILSQSPLWKGIKEEDKLAILLNSPIWTKALMDQKNLFRNLNECKPWKDAIKELKIFKIKELPLLIELKKKEITMIGMLDNFDTKDDYIKYTDVEKEYKEQYKVMEKDIVKFYEEIIKDFLNSTSEQTLEDKIKEWTSSELDEKLIILNAEHDKLIQKLYELNHSTD